MPDRPTDNPGPPSGGDPEKTLHDLLAALANVGEARGPGEAPHTPGSPERSAAGAGGHGPSDPSPLDELRLALDRLFDLVRTERAEARAEIAELEAALATANARIRQLEAGEPLEAPAPPPNDFNQLREAAERLRQRTQELFRDAGAVPQGVGEHPDDAEAAAVTPAEAIAQITAIPSDHASDAAAPDEADADSSGDAADTGETEKAEIASIEAFTKPTVLRVFPGPAGPEDDPELDVESDLGIEDDMLEPQIEEDDAPPAEQRVTAAAEAPVVGSLPVEDELPDAGDDRTGGASDDAAQDADAHAAAPADAHPAADRAAAEDHVSPADRAEPIEIAPRPARKRRAGLRRRRIDARKLEDVDPATALRAMVTSIDEVWTANVTLDLAIALTDGGTLKVTGGHNRPLAVNWVEPGTPARSTVTATTSQLVPLFGRLELTGDQSAPLIHGPRRDADLLVGWIDRAQRLSPEPL